MNKLNIEFKTVFLENYKNLVFKYKVLSFYIFNLFKQ